MVLKIFFQKAGFVLLFIFALSVGVYSQTERNLLSEKYSVEFIRKHLTEKKEYKPFPPAGDDKWQQIPASETEKILSKAEQLLNYEYPVLKASLYLDYVRNGNRSRFQEVYSERRQVVADLLMAEIIENKGRFLDDIINGVWAILEETSWVVPAHIGAQNAGSGLPDFREHITGIIGSETPALLAAVDYFAGEKLDKINPLIRQRIKHEVDVRFHKVMMERDDFWWMGFNRSFTNNWNPWVVSNFITSILYFEEDPERRAAALHRAMVILDNFLNSYPDDGGCDEGPSYWNHAAGRAFNCLELLYEASDGHIDIFSEPLITNMGDYIWKVYIDKNWFVNFADAPAKMTPDYRLIYRYGKYIGSTQMMAFAVMFHNQGQEFSHGSRYLITRRLPNYLINPEMSAFENDFQVNEFNALPDLQVITTRTGTDTGKGLYMAIKGGHNGESHNHNDAGNFIVYYNGNPLLVDAGVGEYTAKTFSPRRYEIWTMQSSWHNLPDINNQQQQNGRNFLTRNFQYSNSKRKSAVSMDLSGAYPGTAGLESYTREIQLNRSQETIDIEESFDFIKEGNEVEFNFLVPEKPSIAGNKVILQTMGPGGESFFISFENPDSVKIDEVVINDNRLERSWSEKLYRIRYCAEFPGKTGKSGFTIKKMNKQ